MDKCLVRLAQTRYRKGKKPRFKCPICKKKLFPDEIKISRLLIDMDGRYRTCGSKICVDKMYTKGYLAGHGIFSHEVV
jgi:hypothetical protein